MIDQRHFRKVRQARRDLERMGLLERARDADGKIIRRDGHIVYRITALGIELHRFRSRLASTTLADFDD